MRNYKTPKCVIVILTIMMSLSAILQGCSFMGGASKSNESDTVRWFSASNAILAALNGQDYTKFPESEPTAENKIMYAAALEQWWSVTDRQTADETLDWLLSGGHRSDFIEDTAYLKDIGLGEIPTEERRGWLFENFDLSDADALYYTQVYAYYEEHGEHAIDAWDYCRALNLLGFYYAAGYYTREESLDKALEIARIMQPVFNSWDDMVDSYLMGYEYWMEESSDERRKVYEDLKSRDDNPYTVDYNTTLEKTW